MSEFAKSILMGCNVYFLQYEIITLEVLLLHVTIIVHCHPPLVSSYLSDASILNFSRKLSVSSMTSVFPLSHSPTSLHNASIARTL